MAKQRNSGSSSKSLKIVKRTDVSFAQASDLKQSNHYFCCDRTSKRARSCLSSPGFCVRIHGMLVHSLRKMLQLWRFASNSVSINIGPRILLRCDNLTPSLSRENNSKRHFCPPPRREIGSSAEVSAQATSPYSLNTSIRYCRVKHFVPILHSLCN